MNTPEEIMQAHQYLYYCLGLQFGLIINMICFVGIMNWMEKVVLIWNHHILMI